MRFSISLLVWLGSTMASSAVSVYLLGGQSNMEGQGNKADLTTAQTTYDNPVKYWNGASFENLTTATITSSTPSRFGPEYGFAKEVSTWAGETIYIIKYAYSGRGLDYRWDNVNHNQDFNSPVRDPSDVNPLSYDNFYPGLSSGHGSRGSRYIEMINAYSAGLTSLANAGLAPDVKGFIWMQGEQDAKNALSADAYSDNLSLLYNRVGEDIGDSTFDLTFGKVLPDAPGFDNSRFGFRDAIRAGMEAADEGSGHLDAIAGATLINTDGLTTIDGVHFDSASYFELGQRLAPNPIPEPARATLLLLGALAIAGRRRRA